MVGDGDRQAAAAGLWTEHFKAAFGITTVEELGTNKFFLWAQEAAKQAG